MKLEAPTEFNAAIVAFMETTEAAGARSSFRADEVIE